MTDEEAQYDPGNGQAMYRPDGGAERRFEFDYDPAKGLGENRDAAVAQAFYTVNSVSAPGTEERGERRGC